MQNVYTVHVGVCYSQISLFIFFYLFASHICFLILALVHGYGSQFRVIWGYFELVDSEQGELLSNYKKECSVDLLLYSSLENEG